jgi:hypothetical protein
VQNAKSAFYGKKRSQILISLRLNRGAIIASADAIIA